MAPKLRTIARAETSPGYPSLHEHVSARRQVQSRRRFLGLTGATLAAGGLAACTRNMGIDGRQEPDASIEIGGAEPMPEYFTVRFPIEGDLSTWLLDAGYATFWVSAVTWHEPSYQALVDFRADAEQILRTTLADFTYDILVTPEGVTSAEDDLHEALDAFCQERCGHTNPTMETVLLTITYLTPGDDLMGDMAEPFYP